MSAPSEEPRVLRLEIEGMTCASCVDGVTRSLEQVPGVLRAEVNLPLQTAAVRVAPGVDAESLIRAIGRAGYRASATGGVAGTEASRSSSRSGPWREALLALLLSVPLVPLHFWHFGESHHLWNGISIALGLPVVFWLGRGIHLAALHSIRRLRADMNLLVSLGSVLSFAQSIASSWGGHGAEGHVETGALIVAFVLFGRAIEDRLRRKGRSVVEAVLSLRPKIACVIRRGEEQIIPSDELRIRDLMVVKAGEGVGADAHLIEGRTTVDESLVTGESAPVIKTVGDCILAGSVNLTGMVKARAFRVGNESLLSKIAHLTVAAQSSRSPIQRTVDRVAAWVVPAVLLLGFGTFVFRMVAGESTLRDALFRSISVLVIACPCALGLATPLAIVAAISALTRAGILVKDAETLERAAGIRVVVFDKTGTLTKGAPSVQVRPIPPETEESVLSVASALEVGVTHPLAHALVKSAKDRGVEIPKASDTELLPGLGVRGRLGGFDVRVGALKWLDECGVRIPARLAEGGHDGPSASTVSGVSISDRLLGTLTFADEIRPEARPVLDDLRSLGTEPRILSGDHPRVVSSVATTLGVSVSVSSASPEQKLSQLRSWSMGPHGLAMVGDGVNDAPALAMASVGISVSHGSDAASVAASVRLLHSDLRLVPALFRHARQTRRIIRQNLALSFAYNLVALPTAAGLLSWDAPSPSAAALLMTASSLAVTLNSLRLQRLKTIITP